MSLLEVKNLTYTYGKSTPFVTHAVDNVSFKIEKGEIIGLIGHTGSGKSTIVQQLNGLIKPES
ncbi:MAG: ATP-binding cassette domain-containing protein, partial [Acutalibacteraceae bacterium]